MSINRSSRRFAQSEIENQYSNSIIKKFVKWLLRRWYFFSQRLSRSQAGFVLQTTMMVLLVLSLIVSSILLRSVQQSEQVINVRENQKVFNAASPAIDRAKAKLEYLFEIDGGFPDKVPSDTQLSNLMLDDNQYKLPDETRIDINNDGTKDNAWAYKIDSDSDGQTDTTIAYSILMQSEADTDADGTPDISLADDNDTEKAANLLTRSGPLSITASSVNNCQLPALKIENGWYTNNDSSLRKRFQFNAVVANTKELNRTVTAMQLDQDRQLDRGNKWAAWFRYDLELYPSSDFNWNGAIHTGGNLMMGESTDKARLYLISSPKSCFYTADASEVTLAQYGSTENPDFQGQVITLDAKDNEFNGETNIDLYPGSATEPDSPEDLNNNSDSVEDVGKPYDYSLNPIVLYTEDKSQSRYTADPSNVSTRDPDWSQQQLSQRIFNKNEKEPYVDDTYRADDRYGPKPKYKKPDSNFQKTITAAENGTHINDNTDILTNNTPTSNNEDNLGLDGYWERRAKLEGLRLIVGQRLQLGNAFGWEGDEDPLYLPTEFKDNEARQRKSLRDNLAAVQAMAVYHKSGADPDFPLACIALTAHPGTVQTISNSTTFTLNAGKPDTDFLTGNGTNGWEFEPPAGVTTGAAFKDTIDDDDDPLRIALSNLARFAGDPDGAFPPKQEAGEIHPNPYLSMWGDFSNLRRVIDLLDSGVDYDQLSIADRTTLHAAACTLGMLAYNVQNKQAQYNSALASIPADTLANELWKLMDGDESNGEVNLLINTPVPFPTNYNPNQDGADFYAQFTLDQYKEAIQNDPDLSNLDESELFAKLDSLKNFVDNKDNIDIRSDRSFGFNQKKNNDSVPSITRKIACDPDSFSPALTNSGLVLKQKKLALAVAFCSPTNPKRRYPSLYYLFPLSQHYQTDGQPSDEEYISDPNIENSTYNAIDLAEIVLNPRSIDDWTFQPSTSGSNPIKDQNDTSYYVPFLDKGIYDGREMLAVRVLDIDLKFMLNSYVSTETLLPASGLVYAFREDAMREDGIARPASQTWSDCKAEDDLTQDIGCLMQVGDSQDPPINDQTGVSPKPVDFYADPDRRPHGFRLRNGVTLKRDGTDRGLSFITDNPVYIQGDFNLHQDSSGNKIEEFEELLGDNWGNFYDRETLDSNFAKTATDNWRPSEIVADGITILSDNFCDGTIASGIDNDNTIANCGSNQKSSYLNSTTKVNSSIKGSLQFSSSEDGWIRENPDDDPTVPEDSTHLKSPIKLDRNAKPLYQKSDGTIAPYPNNNNNDEYYKLMGFARELNTAQNQTVNAVLISGIVPSRPGQSNGGLQNFPRLLENWTNKKLFIAGSFVQLNFSTYADAPFDIEKDGWEPLPNNEPDSGEVKTPYYKEPNRRWGYDVGLQYNPPSPAVKRSISRGTPRSEFYKTLAADDPYIKQLRCASIDTNGTKVDQQATDCS